MTALNDAQHAATPAESVFAGAEVASAAGFTLTGGARGPVFDDDVLLDCFHRLEGQFEPPDRFLIEGVAHFPARDV